ncbi:MAG: prepilin peptidase [Kiloniellaceae bacterium]
MADLIRYHWLVLLLAAPCVGSFLGAAAVRLPESRALLWSRSACPHCGHRLGWRDLVPVLSWLVNRGACRHCGGTVAWTYPAIELAALAVALWSLAVTPGWLAWASSAFGWSLLTLAVIDARSLLLPDEITLPLVPAGLAVAWAVDPARLGPHAIGAAAGFLIVALVRVAYRRLRHREGIGLGDAKLLAAAGAWVSVEGLPGVLLVAAGAALLGHLAWAGLSGRGVRDRKLPFGPYLAGSAWLIWLYGPLVAG